MKHPENPLEQDDRSQYLDQQFLCSFKKVEKSYIQNISELRPGVNVVAGTVIAGFDGFRGWLHHISVAKLYQSQGIARSMIEKALEELSGLGCPKVNLQVRADNHAVAGFYEQLGFTREERASFGINLTNRH